MVDIDGQHLGDFTPIITGMYQGIRKPVNYRWLSSLHASPPLRYALQRKFHNLFVHCQNDAVKVIWEESIPIKIPKKEWHGIRFILDTQIQKPSPKLLLSRCKPAKTGPTESCPKHCKAKCRHRSRCWELRGWEGGKCGVDCGRRTRNPLFSG